MLIGKSLTALGGGGLKPEIRVTAKAGALLNLHFKDSSIILQSYQLGAEETQHTFVVSVSETAYVVDDATNGASAEILVDTVAVFGAEIEYKLYLYRDGDPCNDITGGWYTTRNGGTGSMNLSFNNDHLLLTQSGSWDGELLTRNNIDISDYTNLGVEYLMTNLDMIGGVVFTGSLICGGYGGKTQEDKSCWIVHYTDSGKGVPVVYKESPAKCPLVQKSNDIIHIAGLYETASNIKLLYIYKIWLE